MTSESQLFREASRIVPKPGTENAEENVANLATPCQLASKARGGAINDDN